MGTFPPGLYQIKCNQIFLASIGWSGRRIFSWHSCIFSFLPRLHIAGELEKEKSSLETCIFLFPVSAVCCKCRRKGEFSFRNQLFSLSWRCDTRLELRQRRRFLQKLAFFSLLAQWQAAGWAEREKSFSKSCNLLFYGVAAHGRSRGIRGRFFQKLAFLSFPAQRHTVGTSEEEKILDSTPCA